MFPYHIVKSAPASQIKSILIRLTWFPLNPCRARARKKCMRKKYKLKFYHLVGNAVKMKSIKKYIWVDVIYFFRPQVE